MNINKFSKTDIRSVKRKVAPKPAVRIIKREVLSSEIFAARNQANRKKSKPVYVEPKVKRKIKFAQIGSFAVAGIALVLFMQGLLYLSSAKKASGEILGVATSAYTDLNAASQNLSSQNFSSAQELFNSAQNNIDIAQKKLNNFQPLKWFIPQASSADHILTGAGFLAQAGNKLSTALNLFDELKVSSKGVETQNFNDKIFANRQLLEATYELSKQASREFNLVSSLPIDYLGTLDQGKAQVSELSALLKKLVGLEDLYLNFFSGQKTYLLIFQNYNESRATGGFIGTYGVLGTDRGTITKLNIQSIYQLDGQIYEQIAAPGPMQPDIKRWGIRDANWFANFPTSAEKLLYFFEKGSETVDGVISTTPKLFEDLLKLTGPIEMPNYNVTLTADNFQELVQFKTSQDYDHVLNQPKKFLADFAPILLNRLTTLKKDQWFEAFQMFQNNLNQRQALLYSKDAATQTKISDLGFSGQVLHTQYDYLSIINSNLGGTKTDLSIDQNVKLQSKILSDGSFINTLTISRKNSTDQLNKDFIRVMVPLGSEFVSASGFDEYPYLNSSVRGLKTDPDLANWDKGSLQSDVYIRTESNKSEFSGWINSKPGQTRSIIITYILPFKVHESYSLLLQKQSGSKPYQFDGSLSLGKFHPAWLGPEIKLSGDLVNFSSNSNIDDFWPMVIEK